MFLAKIASGDDSELLELIGATEAEVASLTAQSRPTPAGSARDAAQQPALPLAPV